MEAVGRLFGLRPSERSREALTLELAAFLQEIGTAVANRRLKAERYLRKSRQHGRNNNERMKNLFYHRFMALRAQADELETIMVDLDAQYDVLAHQRLLSSTATILQRTRSQLDTLLKTITVESVEKARDEMEDSLRQHRSLAREMARPLNNKVLGGTVNIDEAEMDAEFARLDAEDAETKGVNVALPQQQQQQPSQPQQALMVALVDEEEEEEGEEDMDGFAPVPLTS